MWRSRSFSAVLLGALLYAGELNAQTAPRQTGPLVRSGGAVFPVPDPDVATPLDHTYRIVFDVAQAAEEPSVLNPGFNTAARFLNMHAQAGVPSQQMQVAIVVHGTAGKDLLNNDAYRARFGMDNPNLPLLEELARAGARVILCGQTAASRDLPRDQLADPVEVALSAMTAHVLLQDKGYRLNPF